MLNIFFNTRLDKSSECVFFLVAILFDIKCNSATGLVWCFSKKCHETIVLDANLMQI